MNQPKINISVYVVDDDAVLLSAVVQAFEIEGFKVNAIQNPEKLLPLIDANFTGIIITDVRMPGLDGISFFKQVQAIDPKIPVIFLTGHADVPMVLSTLHQGAFDFFSKPVDTDHLLATAQRAIDTRRLVLENRELKMLAEKAVQGPQLIGESSRMNQLRETINQIARSEVDVLMEGNTGTGKDTAAQMLHQLSDRSGKPFVVVNCSALPQAIAETELFGSSNLHKGHEKGKIEESNKGTLYLNEIDALPLNLQSQLVPVIERREIATHSISGSTKLSLRVIASTQKDLLSLVKEGSFRSDLYYLLNTVRLSMPDLCQRREDVPLLFAYFLNQASLKYSKKIPKLNLMTQQYLLEHDWPGNVRELKNFAEGLVLRIDSRLVSNKSEQLSLPERVEKFEALSIKATLEKTKGDVRSTLEILGIPRKTFYDKVSRHKINLDTFRK